MTSSISILFDCYTCEKELEVELNANSFDPETTIIQAIRDAGYKPLVSSPGLAVFCSDDCFDHCPKYR